MNVSFRVAREKINKYVVDMYIFNSFYSLNSYNPSFFICLCFNMVSFRGQKKVGARPDRSPLGVSFKISDEDPHPFHMRNLSYAGCYPPVFIHKSN